MLVRVHGVFQSGDAVRSRAVVRRPNGRPDRRGRLADVVDERGPQPFVVGETRRARARHDRHVERQERERDD